MVQGRPGCPATRHGRRVQLQRVHRRGHDLGSQDRPRRAAQGRLPPQLRRRHWGRSCMEGDQGGTWFVSGYLRSGIGRIGGGTRCENVRTSKIIGVDLNPDKEELGKCLFPSVTACR
uniref:Pco147721a n=1 Tax=Arundo donax TaxID=35708 RepID=A0A0A9EYG5_ARUDO